MTSLKNKEIYVLSRDEYIFRHKDVKEAVIKYRTYIQAREEKQDLAFFDEIFGDFKK